MFSIWEQESFYASKDVIIAGGGFSGLWSAYHLKKINPALKILLIEKSQFPTGASTRNAGFACFGSVTELMDDARILGEEKMLELVTMRYEGVRMINKVFKAGDIHYKRHGGYELITNKQYNSKKQIQEAISWLNESLQKTIGHKHVFKLAGKKLKKFNFSHTDYLIETTLEGQLHPGLMIQALMQLVQAMGVTILTGTELRAFEEVNGKIFIDTNAPAVMSASQLLICTNGFANEALSGTRILPARGQVLVTSPVKDLPFKGTFHYDEGFYYFRNLGDRVLLGGARNKAFEEEQTTELAVSNIIQLELEKFLKEVILHDKEYTIEYRWSGIMGMAAEKFPIVKEIQPNCFCLVGLGGMGVALAPVAGEQVAKMMMGADEPRHE